MNEEEGKRKMPEEDALSLQNTKGKKFSYKQDKSFM